MSLLGLVLASSSHILSAVATTTQHRRCQQVLTTFPPPLLLLTAAPSAPACCRAVRRGRAHQSHHQPTCWCTRTALLAKQPLFPVLWRTFQHILCHIRQSYCRQSCKTTRRISQSPLAGFLLAPLSALHGWAEKSVYHCSTGSMGGCPCWVGGKKKSCFKKKISLESLNCIWTLISQRCGKLIKMIMSVFHFLPLSNIHVIGYLPLYLRDLMKNNKCR